MFDVKSWFLDKYSEELADLITTANDGNDYYVRRDWSPELHATEEDVVNGRKPMVFHEFDEETGDFIEPHELTIDKLIEGILKYTVEVFFVTVPDVVAADCVLQLAMFDEIRYG